MHSCIHLVVNLVVGKYSLYQRGRISTYPKGRYIQRTHQRGILYREVYVVGYLSHSDQRQRGRPSRQPLHTEPQSHYKGLPEKGQLMSVGPGLPERYYREGWPRVHHSLGAKLDWSRPGMQILHTTFNGLFLYSQRWLGFPRANPTHVGFNMRHNNMISRRVLEIRMTILFPT